MLVFLSLFLGCSSTVRDEITPAVETNTTQNQATQTQENHPVRIYGTSLGHEVDITTVGDVTLYLPKRAQSETKIPMVFLLPGWGSQNHTNYATMLNFIASQGYAAVYAKSPMDYTPKQFISWFSEFITQESENLGLDSEKIGLIGHSSGGGFVFKTLHALQEKGYGLKGSFLFSMAPWFAFEMRERDFKTFAPNTKVVIQFFAQDDTTDPAISWTIFDKLSSLGDKNRDYQIIQGADHGYPLGSGANTQIAKTLKPLDALMDLVFFENQAAWQSALGVGSDAPWEDTYFDDKKRSYDYKCHAEADNTYLKATLDAYGVDYCAIAALN